MKTNVMIVSQTHSRGDKLPQLLGRLALPAINGLPQPTVSSLRRICDCHCFVTLEIPRLMLPSTFLASFSSGSRSSIFWTVRATGGVRRWTPRSM